MPVSSNSNVARAARQLTGLPPKVEAWLPLGQVMTSLLAIMAPSGMPLAMPLATQTMSGSTFQCCTANMRPVRPMPV